MDFFSYFTRDKQNKAWKQLEELVENKYQDDLESATFVVFNDFKTEHRCHLSYSEFWSFLGEEQENPTECPVCKNTQIKVIYAGAPMRICTDYNCREVDGLFSFIPHIFFNGWFFPYAGGYLKGLWDWLTGDMIYDE